MYLLLLSICEYNIFRRINDFRFAFARIFDFVEHNLKYII